MRQPLPRQAISGTTDASGNASIPNQLKGPAGFYALVYVALQVSVGTPSWAILSGTSQASGLPLVYGSGNQVMLGPILLFPGERATITCSGAGSAATVLGQAMGWMAEDPEELLGVTPLTTSLATPVTPLPISGAVSILGSVAVVSQAGSKVSLIGGVSAAVQGDVSAPTLAADAGTETITTTGGPILSTGGAGVIASFKPATTIAARAIGAVAQGSNTSVSPTFGQATAAGNLLIAWVTSSSQEATTAAAGWVKAVGFTPSSPWADIWYKPNCGANEAPPVFTATPGGSTTMHALLGEFTGALTVNPLDQTGNGTGGPATSLTAIGAGLDAGFGDLVVLCSRWALTSAATATFAETFNNGAAAVHAGDSGGVSQVRQSSFAYAIIPAATTSQPLGVAPWAYDARGTSFPAAGSQASVVLAAVAGKTYTAAMYSAGSLWSAGPASGTGVSLLDGATTIGNLGMIGATAVGAGQNIAGESGLGLKGTQGNSMTLQFNSTLTGIWEQVTLGAYLR